MADRLQMNLVFDIAALRVFGTEKFSARGQIIKKRAHLDLRSRRFAAIAHDVDLAAIHDDFRSGDRFWLACSQSKSRNTGDAR